jgi:hypothetical protein
MQAPLEIDMWINFRGKINYEKKISNGASG